MNSKRKMFYSSCLIRTLLVAAVILPPVVGIANREGESKKIHAKKSKAAKKSLLADRRARSVFNRYCRRVQSPGF